MAHPLPTLLLPQVLRYSKGQSYQAHYDSSYDKNSTGPKYRLATFLMYLSGGWGGGAGVRGGT